MVAMITTHDLTRLFDGRAVVSNVSLEVQAGEIYGFLGPNGSGKTTTIRMLTGILPLSSGEACVAGHDVRRHTQAVRSSVGVLPESSGYYGWMTPVEYLEFFAALYGLSGGDARARIAALLTSVGLAERQRTPIRTFSRGMRARLGIARALTHRPRVLFLDEPTLALDPMGQRDVLTLIAHVNRDDGTTVFLSSHALDQVKHVCHRVGILRDGHLVAQGAVPELAQRLGLPSVWRATVSNADHATRIARQLPIVREVTVLDRDHVFVAPADELAGPEALIQAWVVAGVAVRELVVERPDLEQVFAALVRPGNTRS